METEQILLQDPQTIDIGSQLNDVTSQLTETLAPFIWLSVALSVILIVFYISSMLRRRKVEKAILDIQKTIHEMNERDKARTAPAASSPQPSTNNEIIADTTDTTRAVS